MDPWGNVRQQNDEGLMCTFGLAASASDYRVEPGDAERFLNDYRFGNFVCENFHSALNRDGNFFG